MKVIPSPEIRLWRNVIAQAVKDMEHADPTISTEARNWLSSQDYIEVCNYAHIDPLMLLAHVCLVPHEIRQWADQADYVNIRYSYLEELPNR